MSCLVSAAVTAVMLPVMTRAGNATTIAIVLILIAPTPTDPTDDLGGPELSCSCAAPMSAGIGGPLGTAGKLISDLGQNLEAPRLQMSHRPLRRLLYPAS